MKPIFLCKIEKGKVSHFDEDVFYLYIEQWEGMECDLTIEKHKSSRTIQQNKYLWGVVYKMISDETGYTVEEAHELCKTLFIKKHLDVGEKRYVVIGSTTELSTKEFTDYIENIKMWASKELSLVIPEAENVEV